MINTVLQAIEQFEASPAFEQSQIPTPIYESHDGYDTGLLPDSADDTSDEFDEYKDAQESSGSEEIKLQTDPLCIKQTLKDKIRIRRESEGAGEITNLFEPPKQYKLTPEEELKNEIRKQRNRRSATKSRLKRIAKEKQLAKDAVELEAENEEREREVNLLKKVKQIYTLIIKRHLSSCPKVAMALKTIQPKTSVAVINTGSDKLEQRPLSTQETTTLCSVTQQKNQQSTTINFSMKREATEDINERPFKVPKVLNQAHAASTNSGFVSTVSNTFSEALKVNACTATSQRQIDQSVHSVSMTKENELCNSANLPDIWLDNPQSLFGTGICRGLSTCDSTDQKLEEKAHRTREPIGTDLDTCVTEEQKINKIKQHLFDDFPMTSHR